MYFIYPSLSKIIRECVISILEMISETMWVALNSEATFSLEILAL